MTSAFAGMPVDGGPGPTARASYDRVLDALTRSTGPVRTTRQGSTMARCPVHEDSTASLSVRWTQGDRGGLVLLNCHGCGARAGDVVEALGLSMADLFDEPLPPRDVPLQGRAGRSPQQRRSGQRRGKLGRLPALLPTASPAIQVAGAESAGALPHSWEEVETYPYVDERGELVQEVVRERCTSCPTAHKQFRQLFVVDGQRRKRSPTGFEPVLYRLPQVRAAVAAEQPVWVLEGEKDVHTAEQLGLVATTNTNGGRGFPAELGEVLRGATVHVVLDRDDAGWARGVQLHQLLSGTAASVRLLLPKTPAAKSDFTDHVEAGHPLEDLVSVHVEEVAAWAGLLAARRKHAGVEQALAQTQAQLAAVDDARTARDQTAAEERVRFARRWAVESEIRWEALRDLVDDVRQHVVRTGTAWAGEAFEQASEALRQARTAARAAHDATGIAVPPALQDEPATDVDAHSERDGDTAEVAAAAPQGQQFERQRSGELRAGVSIQSPTYRIVNGQIVQVTRAKADGRGGGWSDQDAGDGDEVLKMVLTLDVQITEMEYLEDENTVDIDAPRLQGRAALDEQRALNPPAPEQLSAVTICYTDPANGDRCERRVPADEYRDCTWLESLPGPPSYDSKPAGLAKLRDAIKAVSPQIRRVTRYRSTGWRLLEGQWSFVHAGGAIGVDGVRQVPVLLTGPLARFDLPDPTQDPARLREAFIEHSAGMLTRLSDRVAAPLLGHVFRSAIGPNPWVLALVGSPGSFKTSIASLAMHHWGELWDRRKPASSMSGNGDTLNALRIKLNAAKDALYWADDVAPTKDYAAAQKLLEEFARMVHNGEQRSRSTRDGQGVLEGTPPRSSALVTSEVMPRPGSGAQRMLVVPLQAEETSLAELTALDEQPSRHGRALLMASLLCWLSADLEQRRDRCLREADRYADQLRQLGESVRQAEAVGHTWAGWVCVTDFLVDSTAISEAERDELLHRVDQGLRAAAEASCDPDLPSNTGARVRELLVHALRSGIAYVDDVHTGDCPTWPLAGRLGWRRTPMGSDDLGQTRYRMEAKGLRFGYVLDDPASPCGRQLLVDSTALEQVLKATSSAMADAPQLDRGTALRALHDAGVLIGEKRVNRPDRLTVQRTLPCEDNRRARMTALRLEQLLGDDPADGADGPRIAGGSPDGDGPGHGPDDGPDRGCPDWASSWARDVSSGSESSKADDRDSRPADEDHDDSAAPADALFGTSDVDDSQQSWLRSSIPPQGLTSPMHEEPLMASAYSDADGLSMLAEVTADSGPCVMCHKPCGVRFGDLRLHLPCWWRSTAASRAAAQQTSPGAAASAAAAAGTNQPTPATTPAATRGQKPQPTERQPAPAQPPSGPVQRPASSSAARTVGFSAPAAVLHTDGVWMPDGTCHPLPEPLRHVGHIAALVEPLALGTQLTSWRAEPGQVWLTREALTALGVDVDALPADPTRRTEAIKELTRGHELVTGAQDEGWQLGGAGDCLSVWTRVWRGEARGVQVALIPAMNDQELDMPVLADAPHPATLARRLQLLADQLQAPWAVSAGATGFDLMIKLRRSREDRERMFAPHTPVPPAKVPTLEQDLDWSRVPSEQERALRYVHAYDRGGSYAAGVAGLELGIGTAEHHPEGRTFDPKLPGYWKVEVPPSGDWRLPHPLHPRGEMPDRPRWITTPGLQLAYEFGYEVPVLAAYVWPEHGRVLDGWYERIRDARTGLDVPDVDAQRARDQLKVIYTRTIGLLGSEQYMQGRPGYAPERRHHIVAKSRSNILRRLAQIGRDVDRWPVAVNADTVLYLSDDPDPISAWPGDRKHLGRGFGQFKPEASGLLTDQLTHLNGRGYRGKDQLDSSWQPTAAPEPVTS